MPYIEHAPRDVQRLEHRDGIAPLWQGRRRRSDPEGPDPTTATRCPFGAAQTAGVIRVAYVLCQSATKRSSRPMPTGSSLDTPDAVHLALRLLRADASAYGRQRGRKSWLITLVRAPQTRPLQTCAMNSGMRMLTGHPVTHAGFLQFRQRAASASAVCSSDSQERPHQNCVRARRDPASAWGASPGTYSSCNRHLSAPPSG